VLPSRLILFDLTFSLVPGPLFLLASVALNKKMSCFFKSGEQEGKAGLVWGLAPMGGGKIRKG
jgi:hypothetical protein